MVGISVVICSYDGESRIADTFRYLKKQTFTSQINWEVFLVDNASTNDLVQAEQKSWNGDIPLHIPSEPMPGRGILRGFLSSFLSHIYLNLFRRSVRVIPAYLSL